MEKFDIQFIPANSQIHCLAHVVNIVVQKILAALDDVEDPEITDDYLHSRDLPFHYDPNNDPDLDKLEREEFTKDDDGGNEEDDAADIMTGLTSDFKKMSVLQKLRTTVTKICSSPQRRKRFRTTAVRVYGDMSAPSGRKLASLMPIRDAIGTWVFERDELQGLKLEPEDWLFLESLGELLEALTKQMSHSSTPTLPWVLPMYEGMRKHLQASEGNAKFGCLRMAAAAGLEKLEFYYSKASDSQLNIIATLLHPSLNITWFRKLDPEHRLTAERAQVLFEHAYESYRQIHANDEAPQPQAPARPSRSGTLRSFLDDICMVDVPDVSKPEVVPVSELKRFWDAFNTKFDDPDGVLTWWKVRLSDCRCIL
ncbi:hypothetical protein DFH07DRAFT_736483 [Mycena maculata]|uniref:HAT C-terminal dimerisation domain-containing protein n=1 Tax=Mycena maculata TaxID=230809 RepID=A0AAD7NNY5_9AGAR|nr:hypothetical protein DFH07DRAFT_736483 [Mycena maculata]